MRLSNVKPAASITSIAFFYVVSLYVFAASTILLGDFTIEDYYHLDHSASGFMGPFGKVYLANYFWMLISGILFLVFSAAERRFIRNHPLSFTVGARRIGLQLSLLIAFFILCLNIRDIVFAVLDGQISTDGIMASHVVSIVIWALVNIFLLCEIFGERLIQQASYFTSLVAVCGGLLIAGLYISIKQTEFEAFATVRSEWETYDALDKISDEVKGYYRSHKKLPPSLKAITSKGKHTPQMEKMTYRPKDKSFQLCASFTYAAEDMWRYMRHPHRYTKTVKGLNCKTYKV